MAYVFKDLPNQNAPATLASAITSGATTIVLTTGTGTLLPSPTGGDLAACRIEQELITYDTRTTDTLTGVTRGVGGTTAVAHSAGKQVRNTAPAGFFNAAGGGGVTAHSALTGLTTGDDHTQYQKESERGAASGYAPLDSGLLVPIANIPTGTTSTTVALGNDSRFPTSGEKAALAGTSGTPGSGNKYVTDGDSRNTNSRTPTAHETTHRSAGSDPLSHANLEALTTGDPHTQYQQESEKGAANGYASLDGSTLVPKAQLGSGTADNTTYLRGDGTWNTPSAGASTSFAGARVYNSGNISVSSGGSGTTLTFDTERYDTDAFHSTSSNTSRLTVPSGKGGKYHMEGHAQFASGTTGERELRVLLNGTTIIAANTEQGLIAENVTVHVSTDYELAVGDYVELVAFQDGIGSLNVLAAGNYSPEFSCSLWGGSGGSGGATELLAYQAAADLHSGTALSAATWTDVGTAQSFTVTNAAAKILALVSGAMTLGNTNAGQAVFRLMIDSTPSKTIDSVMLAAGTYTSPGFNGHVAVGSLSAASHTVKLQIRVTAAENMYLRASTVPDYEALQLSVYQCT